jgi:hypothetical protein
MLSTNPEDCGFEMHDLLWSSEFVRRELKPHADNWEQQVFKRLSPHLSSSSTAMLQELTKIAVDYCGADSSGISLEEPDEKIGQHFRWIAVAGSFEKYLHGTTPRNFSPCAVCVDRWQPQLYKVSKPYYDFLGVVAEPILDGLLIPWKSDFRLGTIWAVSHKSASAFDMNDYATLRRLADLVSLAVRHSRDADLERKPQSALC